MTSPQNCWEFKQCGRQEGGANVAALGICPVSTATHRDGQNHGLNGGRACWAVAGTLCGGEVQGIFAQKIGNCARCEFFQKVRREENVSEATLLLQGFGLRR